MVKGLGDEAVMWCTVEASVHIRDVVVAPIGEEKRMW
jgi:hypothetical protein